MSIHQDRESAQHLPAQHHNPEQTNSSPAVMCHGSSTKGAPVQLQEILSIPTPPTGMGPAHLSLSSDTLNSACTVSKPHSHTRSMAEV